MNLKLSYAMDIARLLPHLEVPADAGLWVVVALVALTWIVAAGLSVIQGVVRSQAQRSNRA